MKLLWTLVITLLVFPLALKASTSNLIPGASDTSAFAENWDTNTDDLIKQRLSQLSLPFEAKYSESVKTYIKRYVVLGSKESESMLGRSSLYFPIFEHYLNLYNLPMELKYLPMVESTLRPGVKSHAGAAGLWQMIPASANYFGLSIDGTVDERLDPNKSTEAAVKMLSMLYDQFGDWPLVMAAYNCGPGRVKKAIRYAKCNDYWEISKYLPKETQRYVPAFIAAAYLVNYYDEHDMAPKYPAYDLQDTRTFVIHTTLRFSDIAKATDVSWNTLKKLNPGFLGNTIPASRKGHFLVIPAYATESFRTFLDKKLKVSGGSEILSDGTLKTSYTTVAGDNIETLALLFGCSVEDIMQWNHLKNKDLAVNQSLTLYLKRNSSIVKP
jgi:membrane-bound lytic murein transglycosylase D